MYIASRRVLTAVLIAAASVTAARADVTVVNKSQETLYVATGQLSGGRIVYGGWTRIDDGRLARVYTGRDERIMLCVISLRQDGMNNWAVGNNFGQEQFMVSPGNFRCEQIGGVRHEWRFIDRETGRIYNADDLTPCPAGLPLWLATFYAVRGDQDQTFVP